MGYSEFPFSVSSTIGFSENDENKEWVYLSIASRNIEVMFKPWLFWKGVSQTVGEDQDPILVFSVFYEQQFYQSSTFDNTELQYFINAPFFDKYGIVDRVGFKIGIGLY